MKQFSIKYVPLIRKSSCNCCRSIFCCECKCKKEYIFNLLMQLGVQAVEVGFPSSCDMDFDNCGSANSSWLRIVQRKAGAIKNL